MSKPANESREDSLFGHAADLTSRFLKSLLGQIAAYATGLTVSVVAFRKLNNQLQGVPHWAAITIIFSPLLLSLVFHTIPALIRERERTRLSKVIIPPKDGYFSLAPRSDPKSFARADKKHDEVLSWIQNAKEKVLYLTGLSGSGKSSIVHAWVLPKLQSLGTITLVLRGYQDPITAVRNELTKPEGIIPQRSDEGIDAISLFAKAAKKVQPHRLLVVFDQFEESLILLHTDQVKAFESLIVSLREKSIANLTVLLVFRSDYTGIMGNYQFPPLVQGENWQEVPPFTENAAKDFMMASEFKVSDYLLQGVLREAAEIDQTKGLIRPITVNLCGMVLGRFTSGVPRGFRPGAMIRGFLQESLTLRGIREVTPKIMPRLITHSLTKVPRTIKELTDNSGLKEAEVRGCMYLLGNWDRGIVRALDQQRTTWEISHDFLVPLIDSIVARWYISFWRRSRGFLPWLATALLIAAAAFAWGHPPEPHFGHLGPTHVNTPIKGIGPQQFPLSRGGANAFLSLSEILGRHGQEEWRKIAAAGKIVFQMTGSTGDPREAGTPIAALMVANSMENDFRVSDSAMSPKFLFLLGDQVLYYGEKEYYYNEFYSPYFQYPAPILALAGNHEGTALQAFLENFCTQKFTSSDAAEGLGRTAQIEPGVYFAFDAPYVRIIALYSNAGEGGGVISSVGNKYPQVSNAQLNFLETQLNRIKAENYRGAVIVAVHHDTYAGMRLESPDMQTDMDQVFNKTGVWPDAVISGHQHIYERFTRNVNGKRIPYIIIGNGGYSIPFKGQQLNPPVRLDLPADDATLESYDPGQFGYLRLIADKATLKIEYHRVTPAIGRVDSSGNTIPDNDSVTIDLSSKQITP